MRPPPSEYFWKVYAVAKKADFNVLLNEKITKVKEKKKVKDDKLQLTEEALKIMNSVNFDNHLTMMRKLISGKT